VQNLHCFSKALVLFAKTGEFSRIGFLSPLGFS
jgi:hypothetical protein